jgi:hypothetical protein
MIELSMLQDMNDPDGRKVQISSLSNIRNRRESDLCFYMTLLIGNDLSNSILKC